MRRSGEFGATGPYEGTKLALPALYRPLSFIPLDIWKSAPSSTNGNEQAHRSINRGGIDMPTLELFPTVGIHPRDQLPTQFRRIASALHRKGRKFYYSLYIPRSRHFYLVLVQKRVAMKQSSREHPSATESDKFPSQITNPSLHVHYSLQNTSAHSIPAPHTHYCTHYYL